MTTVAYAPGDTSLDGGAGSGNTVSFAAATTGLAFDILAGYVENLGSPLSLVVGVQHFQNFVGSAYSDLFSDDPTTASHYDGGAGANALDYATNSAFDIVTGRHSEGITIDLTNGTATNGFGVVDTFVNFQNAWTGYGNDTLIGNSADNILGGGQGADVFVMTAGGGHDTIADFSHAQGDKIDLSAWIQLNSLADVLTHAATSGLDTVITLGPNSVTLTGVAKASLTASDFILEGSYQPIQVNGAYAVAAQESLVFSGSNGGNGAYHLNGSASTLTVSGQVLIQSGLGDTLLGVETDYAANTAGTLRISAGGSFTVSASNVLGFSSASLYGNVENDGTFTVEGGNVRAIRIGALGTVVNAGTLTVTGDDAATGIFVGGVGTITNTGALSVTAGYAMAVDLNNGSIANSGSITAISTGGGASVGLELGSSSTGGVETVANSGTITADTAIDATRTFNPAGYTNTQILQITNSGTIDGQILLGQSAGTILANTRAIHGAIHLGATTTDTYDGRGGTQTGGIYLGGGHDTIYLGDDGETVYGGTGTAVVTGGLGADAITGGSGNDIIDGGGGNDTLDGGAGSNTANFLRATSGITVSLALQGSGQNTIGAGIDTLSNFQNLTGSRFADHLTGDANDNIIDSGGGNDVLNGGGGTNTVTFDTAASGVTVSLALQGQAQSTGVGSQTLTNFQSLTGSPYNDTLEGDSGNNILDGSLGNNTVSYAHAGSSVTVSLALQARSQSTGGAGMDFLVNFQNLTGSAFNDTLEGDGDNNVLNGGGGTNTISYAHAASGVTVSLALQGQAQNTGGSGADTLSNFQNLIGSALADRLSGDGGDNILTGGAGPDVFAFQAGGGHDTVSDFSHAEGDRLDLSAFHVHGLADALGHAVQSARDTTFTFGSDQITLLGVTKGALTVQDLGLPTAGHDLTGTGYSAVVFRDPGGNWGYATFNSSGSYSWVPMGGSGASYGLVGNGDFNGDGISDLLFREGATGNWGFAQMNGSGGYAWNFMGGSTASYGEVAVGDFNGDGTSDIIFREQSTGNWGVAQMHGASYAWMPMGGSTQSYSLAGAGDFNGDGVSDVLFRDNHTGDWGFAQMNTAGGYVWNFMGGSTASYSVVGTGDFNGDGVSDILFRDNATGDWGYAQMHGTSYAWLPMGGSTASYGVVGTGDYNGDGIADVAFREAATGNWGYAAMHGTSWDWHFLGASTASYAAF